MEPETPSDFSIIPPDFGSRSARSLDTLQDAWKRVSENNGSPGIDRKSVEDIRNYGVDQFLSELQEELRNKTYHIPMVKRVYIPKPDGKQRPLGIPTVRDRIVQQAVKSITEPIFEADFKDFSYAYTHVNSQVSLPFLHG